jgi:hypothetical protein
MSAELSDQISMHRFFGRVVWLAITP